MCVCVCVCVGGGGGGGDSRQRKTNFLTRISKKNHAFLSTEGLVWG